MCVQLAKLANKNLVRKRSSVRIPRVVFVCIDNEKNVKNATQLRNETWTELEFGSSSSAEPALETCKLFQVSISEFTDVTNWEKKKLSTLL